MQLIPVILCNGKEPQLYPVSHELHSEPFIQLADVYSLFQKSILRGAMLPKVQKLIAVTNHDIFYKIKNEPHEISLANQMVTFILEPFRHNTAAAVAASALHVTQSQDEDPLLLVLSLDCLNIDFNDFQNVIHAATESALAGKLVTFGMNVYETNEKFDPTEDKSAQYEKKSFFQIAEDPSTTNRLWNSSIFLFKAGALLDAMRQHCPDILSTTATSLKHSKLREEHGYLRLDLDPTSFFSIPEASLNDEVIKKSKNTVMISCDLAWID